MCEELKAMIEGDLRPFVETAKDLYLREGNFEREEDLTDLLRTFDEIVEDIDNGVMDLWECGELYEEFRRHRESGDFLDKIS
ncbi:hypothetical protein [Hydrogenimonas urashimensis]|uniref:hypothetical protein n=1 Tax=Hydrogenimonas urashimensis TaxID=2740515 RepID=UPI00191563DC|nr:hypothetical protein [Hydrogenimonas urashimensis]